MILVTDMCDPEMIRNIHMEHAATFEEALKKAFHLKDSDATISVILDGVSVVVN